jgi:choline dehydrogenase
VETWDDIVVGAGSAGAVMAERLSALPGRRVLLLEAGDRAPHTRPLGRATLQGANWEHTAGTGAGAGRRTFAYPLGRALGGSSAVNGAIALRAVPEDFDAWAAAGCPEWSWERVAPWYAAIESDADVKGAGHGTDGPVPVSRVARSDWDPVATAFLDACRDAGLPWADDLNAPPAGPADCVGAVPSNARGGVRVSTAEAYLDPARTRPELTIRTGAHAHRVLVRGDRAIGVEYARNGRPATAHADRVVLCAGGIGTPLLLSRSGLGPAARLTAAGVEPVHDLPGVGANLSDHPVVTVWAVPPDGVSRPGAPWHQVMARLATGGGAADIGLFLAANMTEVAIPVVAGILRGRPAAAVSAMLLAPDSRGSVALRSADPDAPPVIDLALAAETTDRERLVLATRRLWELLRSGPLARAMGRVLLWTDRMVQDDAMLRASVTKFVAPMCHPAGTARMGPSQDPMSVVDQHGRVHAVPNLLVCDASVMPVVPSAPSNLTCIMLATRVAAWAS